MTAESILRIAIAEPDDHVRAGFRYALAKSKEMEVVFESDDADAVVGFLQGDEDADVTIVGLFLPKLHTLRTIELLADSALVLAVTPAPSEVESIEAISAGARGVVSLPEVPGDLLTAVRAVAHGVLFADRHTAGHLLSRLRARLDRADNAQRMVH